MNKSQAKDSKSKFKIPLAIKMVIIIIIGFLIATYTYKNKREQQERDRVEQEQAVIVEFTAKYPILDKKLLGLKLKSQYVRLPGCSMGKCSDTVSVSNTFYINEKLKIELVKNNIIKMLKENHWKEIETGKGMIDQDTTISAKKEKTEFFALISAFNDPILDDKKDIGKPYLYINVEE